MKGTDSPARSGIDWAKAQALLRRELAAFEAANPRSRELSARAARHLMFGVPLHWMNDWGTPFALHLREASGAHLVDADGHTLVDFCLGDTGAMFGHSPAPVAHALAQRFGLPMWQFALSATDANRYVVRWLRAASGRKKLLVFNGCYHGTIEDAFVDLVGGRPVQRASLLGQVNDLTRSTVVVEFNHLAALEAALAQGDVACVLAEGAMTNNGMVLPDPGYWKAAQALIRRHGTALVIDETHTLSCGPGGYARAHGITADAVVVGKAIGGGMPCAAYGFSAEWAQRAVRAKLEAPPGHSGIGTTLTGNPLAMAAMRATLSELMTDAVYAPMLALSAQLAQGLRDTISRRGLPWCVTQLGARCEFQFSATPPRNGTQAGAALDADLEHLIHLALLNRGVLITPFHNMLLVCPQTTAADVAKLLAAFDEVLGEIAQA